LAGMTAALDLAEQGFNVAMLEKQSELGGHFRRVLSTLSGRLTAPRLAELIEKVGGNPRIKTYLNAKIARLSGYVGNFTTELATPAVTIRHGVVIVAS